MCNCSAICAEMVEGTVGVGEVQGDVATAAISGILVILIKSLDQKLLNPTPNS